MASVFTAIADLVNLARLQTGGEIRRVLNLPERAEIVDRTGNSYDWTPALRRANGTWVLNSTQNAILTEAYSTGGCAASAPVGSGKSLACFCLPVALQSDKAVLLQPGSMRDDWNNERITYSRNFIDPGYRLEAVSYAMVSHPNGTGFFHSKRPDLIIADEADKLANHNGRALSRLLQYLIDYPDTRVVLLSGSLEGNSVRKSFHLFAMALRSRSPLPLDFAGVDSLSAAIDPRRKPDMLAISKWEPLADKYDVPGPTDGEDATSNRRERLRRALRIRLASTQGVVIIKGTAYKGEIELIKRAPRVPEYVQQWLDYVTGTWTDPEGFEFTSHLDLARKSAELSQGFFYRTKWEPHGCDHPDLCEFKAGDYRCQAGYLVDIRWQDARRAWNRAVRQFMPSAEIGTDSNALAGRVAERWVTHRRSGGPVPKRCVPPSVIDAWEVWRDHKAKTPPDTEPVWLDDFIIDDSRDWLNAQTVPSVLWVRHRAVAERLSSKLGIQALGAGPDADRQLVQLCKLRHPPHLILSIAAHGRGKNLQRYHNGLVVYPMSGGSVWEQLIGRFARQGQKSDVVRFGVNLHTDSARDALKTATEDARYSEETVGASRLLLKARALIGAK